MLGGCARDPGGSASGTPPYFFTLFPEDCVQPTFSTYFFFNLLLWTHLFQKSFRQPLLLFLQTSVWFSLFLERTLLLNQHPLNTRTHHSQKSFIQPLLLLRQTPVWFLLVLERTLLWTHLFQKSLRQPLLLLRQTPVWFLLFLERTLLWIHLFQKSFRQPLLLFLQTPVWFPLFQERTLLLNQHSLNTRTRHSQTSFRQPLLLLRKTPVWFLLVLERTLLLNQNHSNTRVWTILCLGSVWQTPWHRHHPPMVGEPSHPLRVGHSQACPRHPLPLVWTQLLN